MRNLRYDTSKDLNCPDDGCIFYRCISCETESTDANVVTYMVWAE